MIRRAQQLGIDTVFDRAVQMKPCAIGLQGICCKNCAMGPCRLPLPKGGIEGEDTRKGLCGATANTIAARNFMPAWSPAARPPTPTTAAAWPRSSCPQPAKRPMLTKSKMSQNCWLSLPHLGVATTVEVDGEVKDRDIDEIALEVAENRPERVGQAEGELHYLKRAPGHCTKNGRKFGVKPATSTAKSSRSCTAPTWAWTRTTRT
jgi:carbon-monoxide dehydrogenase catalytic subunit